MEFIFLGSFFETKNHNNPISVLKCFCSTNDISYIFFLKCTHLDKNTYLISYPLSESFNTVMAKTRLFHNQRKRTRVNHQRCKRVFMKFLKVLWVFCSYMFVPQLGKWSCDPLGVRTQDPQSDKFIRLKTVHTYCQNSVHIIVRLLLSEVYIN